MDFLVSRTRAEHFGPKCMRNDHRCNDHELVRDRDEYVQ